MAEEALRGLIRPAPETGLVERGIGSEVIAALEPLTARGMQPAVVEAADFATHLERRHVVAGRRDVVDRAPERRGAELKRVGASIHFDVLRSQRFDRLEIAATVRKVDRDAVLQDPYSAQMEGPLNARAADRNARLFCAEARLHENAGRISQRIRERGRPVFAKSFGVYDVGATGNALETLSCSVDARLRRHTLVAPVLHYHFRKCYRLICAPCRQTQRERQPHGGTYLLFHCSLPDCTRARTYAGTPWPINGCSVHKRRGFFVSCLRNA